MKFVEFESAWNVTKTSPGERIFVDPQRVAWFDCFTHYETKRAAATLYLENTNVTVFGSVEDITGKLGVEIA